MKGILIFILFIIVFIGAPLTFHYFLPTSLIAGSLTLILLSILMLKKEKLSKFEFNWLFIWIVYAFGLFIITTAHLFYGVNEYRKFFGFIFKFVFIIDALIIIRLYYDSIVKWLNKVTIFQLILINIGVIIIFLKLINITPVVFELDSGRNFYHYFITGASNTIIRYYNSILIRPTGFFEEPGAIALFLIWMLVLNEFTFKSRKMTYMIIFLGLILRSVAFIISIIFYFIIVLIIKKQLKLILVSILSLLLFIIVIRAIDSPHINYAINSIVKRTKIVDGRLGGDNRNMSGLLKYLDAKNIFFGIGNKNVRDLHHYHDAPTGASATGFLLKNGIFGYIFLYLPFLYLFYLYRNDKRVFFFLIIAINLIQRPGIDEVYIILIMTILVQLKNPELKYKINEVFNNNN